MALRRDNGPTPRGDGWAAHMDEVEKGRRSAEVLRETATESPLAFDGTTAEKALQTSASVEDVADKDEGERVSAAASEGKLEAAKEGGTDTGKPSGYSSTSSSTDKK